MIDALQIVVTAIALAVAVVALGQVVVNRPLGAVLLIGLGVLELALLVQCAIGIVQLIGTERDVNGPAFLGYLIGALVIPPAAAVWALGERSRGGTAVVILAGLVVPVMVLRLEQIWNPLGA